MASTCTCPVAPILPPVMPTNADMHSVDILFTSLCPFIRRFLLQPAHLIPCRILWKKSRTGVNEVWAATKVPMYNPSQQYCHCMRAPLSPAACQLRSRLQPALTLALNQPGLVQIEVDGATILAQAFSGGAAPRLLSLNLRQVADIPVPIVACR